MTGSAEGAWQRARGCLGLGREGEGPQHLSPTIRAKWLLGSWQIDTRLPEDLTTGTGAVPTSGFPALAQDLDSHETK